MHRPTSADGAYITLRHSPVAGTDPFGLSVLADLESAAHRPGRIPLCRSGFDGITTRYGFPAPSATPPLSPPPYTLEVCPAATPTTAKYVSNFANHPHEIRA